MRPVTVTGTSMVRSVLHVSLLALAAYATVMAVVSIAIVVSGRRPFRRQRTGAPEPAPSVPPSHAGSPAERRTERMRVRKVLIPAAGLGTRFLPATKAQPKEMLPLIDKPAIQYVVEEAVSVGLDDILIVTGRSKRSIEDHFDRSVELEAMLEAGHKYADLAVVRSIANLAKLHYVRQPHAGGLGHAISFGKRHMGAEPFVVMLGDDIMVDNASVLKRMLAAYATHGYSVVALKRVPREQISSYGCVAVDGITDDGLLTVTRLVEKPAPGDAPSDLAIMGRYLFTPAIFDKLAETPPGRNNEIQITDAMSLLLADEPILGVVFEAGRYDIGNKLDYLRATVELAIDRPDLGADFRAYLQRIVGSWS